MRPSPIELVHSFLASVHFDLNPAFDPEKEMELRFDSIKTTLEADHLPDSPRQWNLALQVAQEPEEGENAPYAFRFHILGMIQVAPGVPDKEVANLARVNGASLLFGIVREQLRILSGSAPFGSIQLPAVSFLDLKTSDESEVEA